MNTTPQYWNTELVFRVDEDTGAWIPWYLDGACVGFTRLFSPMVEEPSKYFGGKLAQGILLREDWKSGFGVEFSIEMKAAPPSTGKD